MSELETSEIIPFSTEGTDTMSPETPYQRQAAVEAVIAQFDAVSESQQVRQLGDLPCEALVYFLRRSHASRDLHEALATEFAERVVRMGRSWIYKLNAALQEEILTEVAGDVMILALTPPPSGKVDMLETAFGLMLHRRIVDRFRRYKFEDQHRGEFRPVEAYDDEGKIERPLEFVPAAGAGPEGILIEKEEQQQRGALVRQGLEAIPDPNRREAFRLFHLENVPMKSSDPNAVSITRQFGISFRTARHWIETSYEMFRRAVGGKK